MPTRHLQGYLVDEKQAIDKCWLKGLATSHGSYYLKIHLKGIVRFIEVGACMSTGINECKLRKHDKLQLSKYHKT